MPVASDHIPLAVLAIGGHGISHPSDRDYAAERERIHNLKHTLHSSKLLGMRLLVVHGNGPQVGRLLTDEVTDLDIHTAQTQGELGYLLAQVLPAPNVAVVTRVTVTDDPGPPIKPIGPILPSRPTHLNCTQVEGGWRLLVPSPMPQAVVELDAVRLLLQTHNVVAAGGGGVPLSRDGEFINAVIDKDWVAAQFAVALNAELLVFATDVDGVYADFGSNQARALHDLDITACRALLDSGTLAAGSMYPKLASAHQFVAATNKRACICSVEDLLAAIDSKAGTQIKPSAPP